MDYSLLFAIEQNPQFKFKKANSLSISDENDSDVKGMINTMLLYL